MKITIISHKHIKKNDKGEYFTSGGFVRAVEGFLSEFEEVRVCAPIEYVSNDNKGEFFNSKIQFDEVPFINGRFIKAVYLGGIVKKIITYSKEWECIQFRIPSYLSLISYYSLKISGILKGKKHIVYVGGETFNGNLLYINSKILRIASSPFLKIWEMMDSYMVKNSKSFVTGNALYQKFKKYNATKIISTTLKDDEVVKLPKEINISTKIKLLYVGRISKEKGLDYLIDSIKLLIENGLHVKLSIVGGGSYSKRLDAYIKKIGLEDYINLLGPVNNREELYHLYRDSDIFILPSLSEGTPKVLLESMSQGTPVIATNVGGIPGVITHGVNGFLISPKSADEICNTILRIQNNPQLLYEVSTEGLKIAQKNTLESLSKVYIKELK